MHPQAAAGFRRMLWRLQEATNALSIDTMFTSVLDIGGNDVNGTVYSEIDHARIDVLDIHPGPNVTIVADATTWVPPEQYEVDLVMTTEMFEHVKDWDLVVDLAHSVCRVGFVGTCASLGRAPHGATGAPEPAPGEWYDNVNPNELAAMLRAAGFTRYGVTYEHDPAPSPTTRDLHWWAIP